jgi:hypothetical protein
LATQKTNANAITGVYHLPFAFLPRPNEIFKMPDPKSDFIQAWQNYQNAKDRNDPDSAFDCAVECRKLLQQQVGEGHTPEKESLVMQSYIAGALTERKVQEMYQALHDHSLSP